MLASWSGYCRTDVMIGKNASPAALFGLPLLAPLAFMLLGTGVAFYMAPYGTTAPIKEPPRGYESFPLPVTVSLPRGEGIISLSIGIAYQRGKAAGLYDALTDRADLLPMLITRVVLAEAENLPASDLQSVVPVALRETFNAELVKLGREPAVLEVFVTSWAATW
jgi:hypothetical protein